MLFDPIVTVHGSLAHVESALTLLVPLSLLLFESGRHRSNTGKIVAGGIAFGLAFATRVSASVIPLTPVLFLLVDSRKLASSFQNRVLKLARGFAQLLFFAFVAYLTLVLVYPPFWRHPVSGFFESLFQYGAFVEGGPGSFWAAFLTTFPATTRATGLIFFGLGVWGFFISDVRSQSLFKLGWIYYLVGVLIVSFGLYPGRYLSSIIPGLGLAGSLAFAHLWSHLESRVGWRSKTLPYLFFLLTISLSSVLVSRDLRLWAERKVLYSQLKASTLGRVHVESPKILIRGPQNLNPRSPTLHLLVQDWHLQLVYWNIAITDRFVRHETFTQGLGERKFEWFGMLMVHQRLCSGQG